MRNLHDLTPAQIQESADRLFEAYPQDLKDGLKDKLPQFSKFVKHIGVDCSSSELNYFTLIKENNIDTTFPNIENLLRIYPCMMVTNCTGERSFSKMKLIKNYLRNTMEQERLNYLTLLNIENDVLKSLNSSEIIAKLAEIKMRRKDLCMMLLKFYISPCKQKITLDFCFFVVVECIIDQIHKIFNYFPVIICTSNQSATSALG